MRKLDILNRKEFVDKLVNLTKNISNNRTSTTFTINGVWGCGKSFVLDMYEEQLNTIQSKKTAADKYFVIRYNCWKYDYYEEPLVAIVAVMIDIINEKTKLWNDEKKRARVLGVLKAVGASLLTVGNNTIKDKTGLDIQLAYQTVKGKVKKEEEKVEKSHEYDAYFSFKQALFRLQDLITELSKDQTVVFVVDEMDRCLPEYSIKVLERLHHLTENSNNVITVLSMDKEQLQTSVKQIFGFEQSEKCEKYFKKFIQFEIELNLGEISENIVGKYEDYINLFDKDTVRFSDSIEEFMQAVFQNIDVREQEQLMQRARLAHRLLFDNSKDYSFMCMEMLLVVMNAKYSSCKKFSKWLDFLCATHYARVENPPFDSFFAEKFENCINTNMYSMRPSFDSNRMTQMYRIHANQSIYSNILYWWYWLYLDNDVYSLELNPISDWENMNNRLEELKKFVDTVNFIK